MVCVASFPGLPHLPSVCVHNNTWEQKTDLLIPCIIVNAKERSKRGRPGTEAMVCVTFFHSHPGVSDSMMKQVSEESFDEKNLRKEEEGKEEADENTSLLSGSKRYI